MSKWQRFVKWLWEQMLDFIIDSQYDTISSHTTFLSQNETQHLQTMLESHEGALRKVLNCHNSDSDSCLWFGFSPQKHLHLEKENILSLGFKVWEFQSLESWLYFATYTYVFFQSTLYPVAVHVKNPFI